MQRRKGPALPVWDWRRRVREGIREEIEFGLDPEE